MAPLASVWLLPAALLIGSSASAMDFTNLSDGPGKLIILARGEIVDGDALKLTGFLEAVQGQQIVGYGLNSSGGNVMEAEKLATIIHGQNVTAGVLSGDMCASACFLMFAAAARRVAAPDALIGVHSVSDGTGSEDLGTMGLTTALARDAAGYKVPAQIIGELVTTQPGQITWLNVNELASMGTTFTRLHPAGYNSREPVISEAPAPATAVAPGSTTVASATAPAQTPPTVATASVPATMSPSFTAGLSDRKAWEGWFGGLTGPAHDGAAFWASQRSLPHPQSCTGDGSAMPPGWVTGCQQAAQVLAPFDLRRRSEPDYRKGWNSI